MPQLLLEILSEEIPARMQAKAQADLARLLTGRLREGGLAFGAVTSWSGPRRLGVCVEGLEVRAADVREERKGPKVGAPEAALAGFLRAAGLNDIAQAQIVSDPKKGDFYLALIEKPGRAATEIIAEAVPAIMAEFPWPKSMTSGYGRLRWVRPLRRIVCLFDGAVVPFAVDGIESADLTEGHRVHGPGPFKVSAWKDYARQLEGKGHVRLTREDRKALIARDASAACVARGLEMVPDEGLLEEVTGLAEWPVVILGDMDPAFLDLPAEVIRLSMRVHQKYFVVRDPKTGELAPHFVVVANLDAPDGGAQIAHGNSRVLSARLNDARFFWDGDRARGLDAMAPKLASIAFKEELGSMADKVERVARRAREIAPKVGADPDLCGRAARLCKADLVSGMVGEFPELQGVMGRYYALQAGERPEVADAVRDHYRPQGPSDAVPSAPVSIALALADKIDTLTGFWAIGEKPTGSGDPYALRRAALGVIRIVLENGVRVKLNNELALAFEDHLKDQVSYAKSRYSPDYEYNLYAVCRQILVGEIENVRSNVGPILWMLLDRDQLISGNAEILRRRNSENEDREAYMSDQERARADVLVENEGPIQQRISQIEWAALIDERGVFEALRERRPYVREPNPATRELLANEIDDLLAFFADRLKVYLREQGARHDLIDAVFARGEDDLVLLVRRVEALQAFLSTEAGAALLAGYRRAANILKAEEKKGWAAGVGEAADPARFLLGTPEGDLEADLHAHIEDARRKADAALQQEDFAGAMAALSDLRAPVDRFFDGVQVNAPDAAIRHNRLLLLTGIRGALHQVADFSRIEG